MSRNKGLYLSECLTAFSGSESPSAFESEIHPSHKPAVCTWSYFLKFIFVIISFVISSTFSVPSIT